MRLLTSLVATAALVTTATGCGDEAQVDKKAQAHKKARTSPAAQQRAVLHSAQVHLQRIVDEAAPYLAPPDPRTRAELIQRLRTGAIAADRASRRTMVLEVPGEAYRAQALLADCYSRVSRTSRRLIRELPLSPAEIARARRRDTDAEKRCVLAVDEFKRVGIGIRLNR